MVNSRDNTPLTSDDEESQPKLKLVGYSDTESSDDEDDISPPQRKRRAMTFYSDDGDEEEVTSQETETSESTEKQQTGSSESTEKQQPGSSVSTEKPSRKRMVSKHDVSDISPKRRRVDTRNIEAAIPVKTEKKPYCFIGKSDSHTPRSCTEIVTNNWDKPIPFDETDSDSKMHIHKRL